jgi:alpha-glucoside transport system substrate-binding protein
LFVKFTNKKQKNILGREFMVISTKLTVTAAIVAATCTFGSISHADVCATPTKLGDMGSFPGEVITVQGSLLGTDQEMFLNTVSCFEKATGAKIQYSGSRDFAALVVADMRSNNPPNIAIFPSARSCCRYGS